MKRFVTIVLFLTVAVTAGPAPPRIVSLSPNMTEILYGIGAFGQVTGVSDYCTYPPEVTRLPSVGGWQNPNLEKLAVMHPDLVIVDDGQAPFVKDNLNKLGFHVIAEKSHTIQDVYDSITSLGDATGHQAEAARLVKTTQDELLRISKRTAGLQKPSVVLIVDRTPGTLRDLYSASVGSYLGELVELAGGRIPLAPAKGGYGKLSKEDLLAANPDIILDFIHGVKSRFAGDPMEAWKEMPELNAVRNGRVRGVNEDFVPHASQRIVQTADLFARLIHPEVR